MRKIEEADLEKILAWRNYWRRVGCEPEITPDEHKEWFAKQTRAKSVLLIKDEIGVVWMDAKSREWSFYLNSAVDLKRGAGLRLCRQGLAAIQKESAGKVIGRVSGYNEASRKIHERLRFVLTSAVQPDILIYERNFDDI